MTNDSKPTTRRAVLTGFAGALVTAGAVGAQETTTEGGETTAGGETTTAGEETTTAQETTTAARGETRTFQVRIVNVSESDALRPEEGEPGPVILSPGAYAAHSPNVQLFAADEPASDGLEALAEDGDPSELLSEVEGQQGVFESGTFAEPVAGGDPGPIGPGDAYGFRVAAAPGDRLSFATMFVPSNDLFFAPGPDGIQFYRDGDAISGAVTDQVALWDAGTEQNEEPGAGPNQAPRQSGPNTGPDENASVRRIENVDDGYEYPSVSDSIQILVIPEGGELGTQTTGTAETATGAAETGTAETTTTE